MKPEDKKEMMVIVCDALDKVVLPELQVIKDDIKDIKETLDDHGDQLETLNGKFDSVRGQADKQDVFLVNHEKRISKLEVKMAIK